MASPSCQALRRFRSTSRRWSSRKRRFAQSMRLAIECCRPGTLTQTERRLLTLRRLRAWEATYLETETAIETAHAALKAAIGRRIPKKYLDPVDRLAATLADCHQDLVIAALTLGWRGTGALAVTRSQLHIAAAHEPEVRVVDFKDIDEVRTRLADLKFSTREAGETTLGSLAEWSQPRGSGDNPGL